MIKENEYLKVVEIVPEFIIFFMEFGLLLFDIEPVIGSGFRKLENDSLCVVDLFFL